MERIKPDTKGRILRAAYKLFYRKGFTRVSVDEIADCAGVTKRTVYYHFNSKDDVIAAVIEVQHLYLMKQYQRWMKPSSNTAPKIVVDLFSELHTWAEGPEWLGSGFSRVSAELADMDGHPARRAASRHKAAVETWLADRFEATGASEAGCLARQVMLLIEGGISLSLIHGDTGYIVSAMGTAERLAAAAARCH
ncbi:TetR/AcrR family transcriptional regulator [Tropicimonas marinistellae]|uniref:TetR/AcrR family transcriptional regulator n=1 Tax=Tropicimonas marinistellae TaxID=1739787 RepID=UPI00082A301D|nr:TetR/AcrR family transcriptional regulator [Tropicimonas marinistellae]